MSKALMGSFAAPKTIALLDEVRALRARVSELEAALAAAERASNERDEFVTLETAEAIGA